ncbi:MAG: phospho-sugar mutase [Flavobacteriales bacterium]|nr:phospho-sugar mutase [Flavobacteriales bacterium]
MDAQELKKWSRMRAELWTKPPFDEATQERVKRLLEADSDELVESFYTDLEFGTGGLRGLMGPGTNRMNRYTLAQTTQGLAQYILNSGVSNPSVVIAYDSRNGSPEFARVAAEVLAGNGLHVHLYPALRPTPQLSFSVRNLGCTAGIVITASHNPKEYNGYKVYWSDGGQIVPPHDAGIIAQVRGIQNMDSVRWATLEQSATHIHLLDERADEAYLQTVINLRLHPGLIASGSDLPIVYTPLHGTGSASVIPALEKAGFRNIHIVESQREPDGNFPTVHSPNPEEGAALAEGIALARQIGAQLVMGTDPDSDRVGIAVPDASSDGGFRLLNGNETGALLVDYVLEGRKASGQLNLETDFVAKTIVTSELMAELGRAAGLQVHETLTGFKWIADTIRREEGRGRFVVGGEESYGYMIGDAVRDKDAVAAACLLAELAHAAHEVGSDLLGQLEKIHHKNGAYKEALVSQTRHGRTGKEEIARQMESFRLNPPATMGGERVVEVRDFQRKTRTLLVDGTVSEMSLPASNVIQFLTDKKSLVTARPSGTEPKIKFYFSVHMPASEWSGILKYEIVMKKLDERIERLKSDLGVH